MMYLRSAQPAYFAARTSIIRISDDITRKLCIIHICMIVYDIHSSTMIYMCAVSYLV